MDFVLVADKKDSFCVKNQRNLSFFDISLVSDGKIRAFMSCLRYYRYQLLQKWLQCNTAYKCSKNRQVLLSTETM